MTCHSEDLSPLSDKDLNILRRRQRADKQSRRDKAVNKDARWHVWSGEKKYRPDEEKEHSRGNRDDLTRAWDQDTNTKRIHTRRTA